MDQSKNSPTEENFAVANVSLSESNAIENADASPTGKHIPTLSDIERRITEDVDSWSVWKYEDPYRTHLGASAIGKDCTRELWYGYRWVKADKPTAKKAGRIYRLFNRGHREEPQVFEFLRGIGWTIYDLDNNGKQHLFSAFGAHYGGSVDAVGIAPERYNLGNVPILISVKTSGTGAAFNKYDEPMQIANPVYWAQEHAYGRGFGIDLVLWVIINKNDDDITFRLQQLDPVFGEQLEKKAQRIIFSHEPPDRISKSPAYKTCSVCNYKGVCHADNAPDMNCRSCFNAQPHPEPNPDTGKPNWFCTVHQSVIPSEVIPNACEKWNPITKPRPE